jgi:hypothetical protein
MTILLGKVQYGVEAPNAHGTQVAASLLLPIEQKEIQPDSKPTAIPYDIGKNVDVTGVVTQGKLVEDTFSWSHGFFEQFPLIHSLLLKGGITPTEKTEGEGDFEYDNTPSLDPGDNALDSISLERGDSQQPVKTSYCMFKKLTLDWSINQSGGEHPVKVDVDWFGRENVNGTYTASVETIPLTYLNAILTRLWLDTSWAGVGTTEVAHLMRSGKLEIIGGAHPSFSNGGTTETFAKHEQGPVSFLLSLTLERGTVSEALRAATGQFRTARLAFNGPVIGTGVNHLLQYDLGGYIEDVVAMASDDQGTKLDTLVLHGKYDAVGNALLKTKCITDMAGIGEAA